MTQVILSLILAALIVLPVSAKEVIPFTKEHWDIQAKAHVLERYKGQDAIYLHQGAAILKQGEFLNGTIEFDVYMTPRQSFPGVYFRQYDGMNEESFFLRPHLSGKPDANQAASVINGVVGWQLYFGDRYSFKYDYHFDRWTHIKLVVNGDKAQVFLDHSEKPNLSWYLKHKPKAGKVSIGGGFAPMHYANFKIDKSATQLVDFKTKPVNIDKQLVQQWLISDSFEEVELKDLNGFSTLVEQRKWLKNVRIEENNVANISWVVDRRDRKKNTVLAKLVIHSDKAQTKRFEFGYSDRVIAYLNGQAIYGGTNRWRTRDYRYLGTVGLFDSIFLNLKKGENTLLMAVSEDFGGWGVTGKFVDNEGIRLQP